MQNEFENGIIGALVYNTGDDAAVLSNHFVQAQRVARILAYWVAAASVRPSASVISTRAGHAAGYCASSAGSVAPPGIGRVAANVRIGQRESNVEACKAMAM